MPFNLPSPNPVELIRSRWRVGQALWESETESTGCVWRTAGWDAPKKSIPRAEIAQEMGCQGRCVLHVAVMGWSLARRGRRQKKEKSEMA